MMKIVNFVHTSNGVHAIIINVKTPQYIIWFLLHPIVKIPSPKKTVTPQSCLFYFVSDLSSKCVGLIEKKEF